jgi:VanZ family protein
VHSTLLAMSLGHASDTTRRAAWQRWSARQTYALAAFALMLFTVYASLLPFDFRAASFSEGWLSFRAALAAPLPERVSRTDVLANVLLFVPIGFALGGAFLAHRAGRLHALWAVVAALPISLTTSVIAELGQTFTDNRVPTKVDIASQTLGYAVGFAAWVIAGQTLTTWVRQTLAASPENRLTRALAAYTAAWVFVNLAPFDVTLDLGLLGQRVRAGEIWLVPFTEPHAGATQRLWDWIAETAAAMPIGMLAALTWGGGGVQAAWAGATALVAGVELAQVVVRSHSATGTDFVLASAGALAGAWIARWFARGHAMTMGVPRTRVQRAAFDLFVAWALVACLYHWQPYDFTVDAESVKRKLAAMSLLPFANYIRGPSLNALNDLLTKVAIAAPLGVAAAFTLRAGSPLGGAALAGWLLAFGAVLGGIELGQFFIPSRVPDPSDVFVGVVAATAGLLAGRWVWAGLSPAAGARPPR